MPGMMQGMPGMMGDMPGMMQGMPGMMGDMPRLMEIMREQMAGRAMMRPFDHIDAMLAFYRTELHITDTQQEQWNAFAAAFKATADKMRHAISTQMDPMGGQLTAPQRIERRIDLLTTCRDALKSIQSVAQPLYAALSDEQKRIADELLADHFRSMRRMVP